MKLSTFFPTFLCFGVKKVLYIIKMLFFRAFYETEVQYLNHFCNFAPNSKIHFLEDERIST